MEPARNLVSPTYPIPAAALDDRLAWLGTAGSGKTYNAGGGVEQLLSGERYRLMQFTRVGEGSEAEALH